MPQNSWLCGTDGSRNQEPAQPKTATVQDEGRSRNATPDLYPAETLKGMRSKCGCELTEDGEAKVGKALVKFKLQSSLMFKGKC